MELDRSVIKERSRQIIRDSNPKVLTASLIVIALSVVISMLSSRLVGVSVNDLQRYLQYVQQGETDAALRYLGNPGPCGNEWANQALFDYRGRALPAVDVLQTL